jgi:large subunit ribosomal protein L6
MKKQISEKIKIPSGVEVEIEGNKIIVKGKNGTNERSFSLSSLKLEKKGDEIIIGTDKGSKKEKMRMYTIVAHIKNMMKGVEEKFEYKLKICFGHFPITVEIKGKEAIIKNFLGEKVARKAKIPEGAEVEVSGDVITIQSKDIETAGQAAANLETATRIPNRDRRVFQDGIFMTSKCGEAI